MGGKLLPVTDFDFPQLVDTFVIIGNPKNRRFLIYAGNEISVVVNISIELVPNNKLIGQSVVNASSAVIIRSLINRHKQYGK